MAKKLGGGWLTMIAVFKLVKAAGLVALGVVALTMAHGDSERTLAHWEAVVSFAPGHKIVHEAIAKVAGLEPRQLVEIGVGTFIYASVFVVEGVGLLMKKRWAEYVTSIVTLSFIPLEIYELAKRATAPRVIALVVNVLVVVYLIWRIRRERKDESSEKAGGAGAAALAAPH